MVRSEKFKSLFFLLLGLPFPPGVLLLLCVCV